MFSGVIASSRSGIASWLSHQENFASMSRRDAIVRGLQPAACPSAIQRSTHRDRPPPFAPEEWREAPELAKRRWPFRNFLPPVTDHRGR
jgi:hypothetical protein